MNFRFPVFAVLFFSLQATFAQPKFNAVFRAREDIYLFNNGKYDALYKRMDKEMQRMLDLEKIEGLWGQIENNFGNFKETGEIKVEDLDTLIIAHVPLIFEKKKVGIRMVYTSSGYLSGMWLEPVVPVYQPPDYINASRFYEVKKNVPNPEYPSEGILTLPMRGNKFPLLIIVGGSGPTDKDLTIGPNRIYKDLAWGVAQSGVAVYRYNKRTVDFGAKMKKAGNITVEQEYLQDLEKIVHYFATQPNIDSSRIVVLGHSEAGYLVPYFEKNIKGVAGYIILAGSYRNLEELVVDQLIYLKAHAKKDKKEFDPMIAKALYMRDHLHSKSPSDSLMEGLEAVYLLHLRMNSPEMHISNIMHKPVIIMQGGRDYQVVPAEYERWKIALKENPKAQFNLYPKLNHLFFSGKGDSVPEEYERPANVDKQVVLDLRDWILKLPTGK